MIAAAVSVALAALTGTAAAGERRRAPTLRLDQIQVIGTHNSYHLPPRAGLVPHDPINIAQAPLDVQLDDQNVRSFELDVYDSPQLRVFHSLVVDEKTSCPTMEACLEIIDEWSREHPRHVPVTVLVEPKQLPTSPDPDTQAGIDAIARDQQLSNWDATSLERLDDLVREVFGNRRLITPDEVQGKFKTLRAAVLERGWPSLRAARGKVVVALNTGGPLRDLFVEGHESLEGRAMFVTADPDAPYAAVVKRDDPDGAVAEIRRLVRRNFLVRTRADEGGVQARIEDPERARDALRSGAQIVSTDYPVANLEVSPYVVTFPDDRPVRCNPVSAPPDCRRSHLPEP